MSIRSIAAADYAANLIADGDPVTLETATGGEQTVNGWVKRIEAQVDPQTLEIIIAAKTVITVPTGDITGDVEDEYPVSTTDGTGAAISGRIMNARMDHTLCFVTFDVEAYS